MSKKYVALTLLSVVAFSGCTREEIQENAYHWVQPGIHSCTELPESQYEECIKQVQEAKSYQEYKKERNEAIQ